MFSVVFMRSALSFRFDDVVEKAQFIGDVNIEMM